MDYQRYLHWTYFGDHAMDAEEFERMGRLFEGVDLFVDVGASHGVYTFHALQHVGDGAVVAIEADPTRFAILESNVAEWSATSDVDVTCLNAAASDDDDLAAGPSITFWTTDTQISGGLFPVAERSDEYAPIEVPLLRLDDVVAAHADERARVLVKIDVEGGELRVLRGARSLIASGRATFFVELSWWGDRDRGTSIWSTLRFAWRSGLGIERRLRSDYLLALEPDGRTRLRQYLRVVPPLLPRWVFGRLAPRPLRTRLIRRQNEARLARAPVGTDDAA